MKLKRYLMLFTASFFLLMLLACSNPAGSPGDDDSETDGSLNNAKPVASAGTDKSVSVNTEVSFDASASTDSDGTIESYSWDFGDGSSGSGEMVNHNYTETGRYTVTLTVTDNDGKSSTVRITVDVTMNISPVADAGGNKSAYPGDIISFAGSGTDRDSDDITLSYHWDFGDGNSTPGANVSHSYSSTGEYTVTLTITDDEGAIGTASVVVYIVEEGRNLPPCANAGANRLVLLTDTVSFDGSKSTDDNKISSYNWDFGDGTSGSGKMTSHKYNSTESHKVKLTVTDNEGSSSVHSITVTVNDQPVAYAGIDQIVPEDTEGTEVFFNGSGSNDNFGEIASYDWDFGDGISDTGATPSHKYSAAGIYTVSLIVTDSYGEESAGDVITVTVNDSPTATAGNDKIIMAGDTASFDASGSSDTVGGIDSYSWDFADGTTESGVTPTHSYSTTGTYTVTLTVTDIFGATSEDSVTVTVNDAPIADAGANQSVELGTAVSFDASASTDGFGGITSYNWVFGDSTTESGITSTHSYSTTGTYTVYLTVADSYGASATDTVEIEIYEIDSIVAPLE